MTKRPGLIPHTVEGPDGGRLAGYLVRDPGSMRHLGYIWPAGATWRWRTVDGRSFGERATQRAAVQVLCDAATAARQPALPRTLARTELPEQVRPEAGATPLVTKPRVPFEAPRPAREPERHVVWPDDPPAFDPASLTSAIAAALRRHQR
jgi:hypothetical protein